MLFALSKILWFLFSPVSLLVLLFALGLLAMLLGRLFGRSWGRRWGGRLVCTSAAVLVAVSLLPVDSWLLRPLEERFPQVTSLPERVDGVVVLGGALSPLGSAHRGAAQLGGASERIFTMLELTRRYPEAEILFSGGTASLLAPDLREADEVRKLLAGIGALNPRMTFERASRNTRENALYSRDLVAPGRTERWLLVTSAFHMPRAMGAFRALDWPVVAYPVDYQAGPSGSLLQFDPLGNWARLQLASKEWVGLAYYRLRGWTERFFPGPESLGGS
ncbi:MAG: YdcF family protein [Rhodovibrionaceae bacterium]